VLKIITIFSFLLFFLTQAVAQEMQYTYDIIGKLTSKEFAGRGYVNGGHLKAAQYIENQYRSLKLKPGPSGYFQNFNVVVNTFGGSMDLAFNGCETKPGKDFILMPYSGGGKGTFQPFIVKSKNLKTKEGLEEFINKDLTEKVLVIEQGKADKIKDDENVLKYLLKEKLISPKAIILVTHEKLTASYSDFQINIPFVIFKAQEFPTIVKSVKFNIDAKVKNVVSQNVIGHIPGILHPDTFIVVSAHYDHLGTLGKDVYFPGANDNASGVSMMLQLAKYFDTHADPRNYTIVFIAFGGEELGLKGSEHYVYSPIYPLAQTKFVLNLDIVGTGDNGIKVVNGNEYPKEFNQLKALNEKGGYLSGVFSRGKARNSDHYYFTENGVKAFFIYTLGGSPAYHDIQDNVKNLTLYEYKNVFSLLRDFLLTQNSSAPNHVEILKN
jgi:aminopeptidase YwaD